MPLKLLKTAFQFPYLLKGRFFHNPKMLKLDVSDEEMLTKIDAKCSQVAKFACILFTGLLLKDIWAKGVPNVWSQTVFALKVSHEICEAILRANMQRGVEYHAV